MDMEKITCRHNYTHTFKKTAYAPIKSPNDRCTPEANSKFYDINMSWISMTNLCL